MKAKKHFDLLPKNRLYINHPAISLIDHLPEATAKKSQRKTPDNKSNDSKPVYSYSIHLIYRDVAIFLLQKVLVGFY